MTEFAPTGEPPEDPRALARRIETARRVFTGPIDFLLSAPKLEFLPEPKVPEIAFAGRSNVGKSSLLNALTGRQGLARTSNTPGRTQELNAFNVGEPLSFRLIDMPGYGYAEAPKDIVRAWQNLVFDYLRGRAVLKRVLLLIDARHGLKPVDLDILKLLDKAAVSYQIVLTKGDKIKPTQLEATRLAVEATSRTTPPPIPPCSPPAAKRATASPNCARRCWPPCWPEARSFPICMASDLCDGRGKPALSLVLGRRQNADEGKSGVSRG